MHRFLEYLRHYRHRKHVRPWALSAPIIILLVCLPLLRPLRHPDTMSASSDEIARLLTIQSIVEHDTLSIESVLPDKENDPVAPDISDATIQVGDRTFSNQPPVMAALLSCGYRLMYDLGLRMDDNPVLVPYLLTLLGVTIPVAASAGIVYRMSRIFEIPRYWRAALALCVVLASGLVSYAVVLNSHAPAAALLLASAACLTHMSASATPARSGGWMMIAGFCAALAAVIDLPAVVFLVPLGCVIFSMRWKAGVKIGAVLLYLIGITAPIVLHAVLMVPITGDLRPGVLHPELASAPQEPAPIPGADADDVEEFEKASTAWPAVLGRNISRVMATLLGPHGVLSHFPILLVGIGGILAVMHRHWPSSTKALACVSIGGAVVVMIGYALSRPLWNQPMFATRWFIVFLPLVLFWSGAWLRRKHHPVVWAATAVLLAFSIGVSLIGATDPFPRNGFDRYTAVETAQQLLHPQTPAAPINPVIAGG